MGKYFVKQITSLTAVCLSTLMFISAQGQVYNTGSVISIRQGAVMSISGDYTDASATADAPLYVAGSLYIGGNIYNNSTSAGNRLINHFTEAKPFLGRVILTGGNPTIGGTNTGTAFFPTLELDVAGTASLSRNITIGRSLDMTEGNLDLNGRNVILGNNAVVNLEDNAKRIFGSDGAIAVVDSAGTVKGFTINTGDQIPNFRNIGIGLLDASNFGAVTIVRRHGVSAPYDYPLADGVRTLRSYEITTETDEGVMDVSVQYFIGELNGLTANSLALYISNDNGVTWRKCIESSVNTATQTISAPNVRFTNASTNIVAVSIADCVTQRPDVSITSVPSPSLVDGEVHICETQTLSVAIQSTFRMLWTIAGTPTPDNLTLNSISVPAATRPDDTGVYHIWAANTRGCEDANSVTVTVQSNPVAAFTVSPPRNNFICFGTEMTFDDESTNADGSSFTWLYNFNDALTLSSTEENPVMTYSSPGRKNPTLVVTSSFGCVSNTAVLPPILPDPLPGLDIESLPNPSFEIHHAGALVENICEDIEVNFPNGTTYEPIAGTNNAFLNFTWDFGDASPQEFTNNDPWDNVADEQSHTFVQHGSYSITLRATVTNTGCYADFTNQIPFVVNPEPIPLFEMIENGLSVNESCPGINLTFQNGTTMPDGTGITYAWNFNDGSSSTDTSPVKQYTQHAPYNVMLTATSTAYGCFESVTNPLTINPQPIGSFTVSDPDVCPDENALFLNSSTVASGTLSYNWDFDDGSFGTSSSAEVTHSYSQPRQYSVKLTRTTDQGCTNTVSRILRVRPAPVAQFLFENKCDGETVEFTNLSALQSGSMSTYQWNFGDGATASEQSTEHLFAAHGNYNVSLIATSDFGCVGTDSQPVTIFQNPAFNLGLNLVVCAEQHVIDPWATPLAANHYIPANSTFEWRNSSGAVVGNELELEVSESDTYQVKITTSPADGLCEALVSVPVYLFDPVDLGQDKIICGPEVLDAGTNEMLGNTSYFWNFNSIVSTERTFFANQNGEYSVTVTHEVGGKSCNSNDQVYITLNDDLSFTLPLETPACIGSPALLASPILANAYAWYRIDNGNRTLLATTSSVEVEEPGFYVLRASNGDCFAESTTEVVFYNPPAVSFAVSDISICQNETVSLNDLSYGDGLTMSTWSFGDGTSASYSQTIEKQFSAPGNYLVQLTGIDQNNCASTFGATIIVNAIPVANFVIDDFCSGSDLPITNNSSAGLTYHWDFGDGTSSAEFQPTKSFDNNGQFSVTLSVSSPFCSSEFADNVTIFPRPILEFGDQIATCGTSLMLDAGNIGSTYRWFDPNSNATLSTSQQLLINADGEIGVEITNGFGCFLQETGNVALGVPITASLGADRQICDQERLFPGYFPGANISWMIPGSASEAAAETVLATTSGNYSVNITDQNGCVANASVNLEVRTTPTISLNDVYTICEGDVLNLIAGTNATYTYLWSTGESQQSLAITTPGNFTVAVDNGICHVEKQFQVAANPTPIADFTFENVCFGEGVIFSNQSTLASGQATYVWDFGNGAASALVNPTKVFQSAGDFNVSLTVMSDRGCVASASKPVTIHATPVADFITSDACSDQPASIQNMTNFNGAGALTYEWNFGNGNVSASEDPEIVYTTAGDFLVSLKATSAMGCSDTQIRSLNVLDSPSLSTWQNAITSCNESVLLSAGNAGSTYLWSNLSSSQSIAVSQSGNYSVLITAPNGCSVQAATSVEFDYSLQSQLAEMVEGCGSVTLDPQVANAATYLWSTGQSTPTIVANSDGEYSLQVIGVNLCIGKDTTMVDVHAVPIVELGESISSCEGQVVTLSANTNVPAGFVWSTSQTTSAVDVSTSGLYEVTATSDKDCVYKDAVQVTFNPLPVIPLPQSLSTCGGVILDANNPGSAYTWSNGAKQQKILVTQSGTYAVRVTDQKQCSADHQVAVTVLPLPEIELGPDITVCHGETQMLTAGEPVNQYTWSTGATSRSITVGSSGKYVVTALNLSGCVKKDSVNVIVRSPSGLELGADKVLCNEKQGVFLTAGVDNVSYRWESSNGFAATTKDIRAFSSGVYTLSITDAFNCVYRDSIAVKSTTQTITANFLIPSVVNRGDIVHFVMLTDPDPTSILWRFGDGGFSTEKNPTNRYAQAGEFFPKLIVSNGVCSDTLTKSIVVRNGRFEVMPELLLPELIEILKANAYPNPFRDAFKVELQLSAESKVMVTLYSMKGVVVDQRQDEVVEKEFEFDVPGAADGVYLVKITTVQGTKVIKVIKTGGENK